MTESRGSPLDPINEGRDLYNNKIKDKTMEKNLTIAPHQWIFIDGDCKLKASDIDLSHFKTRDRYRDGERVGYDRLWISIKAEARDWIRKSGLEGDCFVFGLGNKNITFIAQGDKIFYNKASGAQALEYIKAWSRWMMDKYGDIEIEAVDYLPTMERPSRAGGRKIQTLDDLMEATLCKADDRDYGI